MKQNTIRIKCSALRKLIKETIAEEQFMSVDDAIDLISSKPADEVAPHDIVDEDSGEVYVATGQAYGTSVLHPEFKAKLQQKQAAKRAEYEAIEAEDERASASESSDASEEFDSALTEFSDAWRGYNADIYTMYNDEGTTSPEAAAQDVADDFFSDYPQWKTWARQLDMTREDIRSAVVDRVYDAMIHAS
jgi:hypothetical protein